MKEKIRSKFVKESLLDYENLANTLKENTSSAVKDLLNEAVRDTYAKLLSEESDAKEEGEGDDSDAKKSKKSSTKEALDDATDMESGLDGAEDYEEEEVPETEGELGGEEEMPAEEPEVEGAAEDELDAQEEEQPEEDGWGEFDKYKVSDDSWDLSNAKDSDIVKVYKMLKDDDQVIVNVDKDSKKVDLKDNETGAEYILDLGSFDDDELVNDGQMEGEADDIDAEGDLNNEGMNEERIFEIALNEYDSHVGYTDNYQSKDVMTNPGMSEPGKNVNDWDAGVPKDSKKPWARKGSSKPFDKKGATTVEEGEVEETMPEGGEGETPVEEANLSQSRWNDTHAAHNRVPAANDDAHRRNGIQKTSKGARYRAHGTAENTNESRLAAKAEKIMNENKQLKTALKKFKNVLSEAAVTNLNLGQIIKLISENSTTRDEKQEIIARFGKEANTIEESKKLYESLNRELKKNSSLNINEEKQFTTSGSKMINETQIYKSKDLIDSLDLMHRICL